MTLNYIMICSLVPELFFVGNNGNPSKFLFKVLNYSVAATSSGLLISTSPYTATNPSPHTKATGHSLPVQAF